MSILMLSALAFSNLSLIASGMRVATLLQSKGRQKSILSPTLLLSFANPITLASLIPYDSPTCMKRLSVREDVSNISWASVLHALLLLLL